MFKEIYWKQRDKRKSTSIRQRNDILHGLHVSYSGQIDIGLFYYL